MIKKSILDKSIIKFMGGDTWFIAGIPARDLTLDEFEALSEAQQKQCIQSGLYLMPEQEEEADDA